MSEGTNQNTQLKINTKSHLLKLKIKIKNWEANFHRQNKRKPDRNDMKNAPNEIQVCYKNYWQLRNNKEKYKVLLNKDNEIFSSSFNKSNNELNKSTKEDISSTLGNFSHKLQQYAKEQKSFSKMKLHLEPVNGINDNEKMLNTDVLEASQETETDEKINSNKHELAEIKSNFFKTNKIQIQLCDYKKFRHKQPLNVWPLKNSSKDQNKFLHYQKSKIDLEWLDRCFSEENILIEKPKINSYNNKTEKEEILDKCIRMNQNHLIDSYEEISSKNNNMNIENLNNSYEYNPAGLQNKIDVEFNKNHYPLTDCQSTTVHSLNSNQNCKEKTDNLQNKTYDKSSYLKRKLSTGTINENYVKINIKKKKFVKGYKHFSIQNYKKTKWKKFQKQKQENNSVSSSSCFNCGKIGHWARNCPDKKDRILEEMALSDDLPLLTLQEAKDLAQGFKLSSSVTKIMAKDVTSDKNELSESILNTVDTIVTEYNISHISEQTISSIFNPVNGKVIETPPYIYETLNKMGYSSFRFGQEETIMRILSGLSTLLISLTGSGKSLCYQLPAYIYAKHYKCFTLVISPLVSLMEDQIARLPQCIKAVCIHSGMNIKQRHQSFEAIINGTAQILLLSSEAIVGYKNFTNFFPSNLPPVAFACIDEAHCLSEWSHNFRPSYLQLRKVLKKKFGINCILALTATATKATATDIAHHLEMDIENGVIGQTVIPSNLFLTVSCPKYRDESLIELLKHENFIKCNSILIYCTKRDDTERLASLIRTQMQNIEIQSEILFHNDKKKRKRILPWDAEAYHAGLSIARRKIIQNSFMSGKLRVVVATVAFGMGLNKANIHGVIHYNMPKTFESYVQEIGRSGRDGELSHCHVFLESGINDINELQRHIYANGIDRHTIRRFLEKLFNIKKIICQDPVKFDCPGHEIAIPINSTVQDLDIKEENLLTLLCYLEIYHQNILEILCPIHTVCSINCYKGYKQLIKIGRNCAPLAVALALNNIDVNKDKMNQITFSVIDVASEMGWDSKLVIKALKNLEWNNGNSEDSNINKTGIIVKFSDLAFRMKISCNLSECKKDEILDFLYNKIMEQEKFELARLHKLYTLFKSMAFPTISFNQEQSDLLKFHLQEYFKTETRFGCDSINNQSFEMKIEKLDQVRSTICNLICSYHDQNFSGRAIARILHGIGSPCFPSEIWSRVHRFWRCHLDVDFNYLIQIANEEILKLR